MWDVVEDQDLQAQSPAYMGRSLETFANQIDGDFDKSLDHRLHKPDRQGFAMWLDTEPDSGQWSNKERRH